MSLVSDDDRELWWALPSNPVAPAFLGSAAQMSRDEACPRSPAGRLRKLTKQRDLDRCTSRELDCSTAPKSNEAIVRCWASACFSLRVEQLMTAVLLPVVALMGHPPAAPPRSRPAPHRVRRRAAPRLAAPRVAAPRAEHRVLAGRAPRRPMGHRRVEPSVSVAPAEPEEPRRRGWAVRRAQARGQGASMEREGEVSARRLASVAAVREVPEALAAAAAKPRAQGVARLAN